MLIGAYTRSYDVLPLLFIIIMRRTLSCVCVYVHPVFGRYDRKQITGREPRLATNDGIRPEDLLHDGAAQVCTGVAVGRMRIRSGESMRKIKSTL